MKRRALIQIPLFLMLTLALTHASHAQFIAGPGVTDEPSSQPVSSRNFSFSGTIPGQLDGALSVTFFIYPDQQSATALWTETQVVQITNEKYSVMLGSTSATGLPSEIFSADQAHWLGVQVNGSEKRFLLVSVPYAMKAVNADQLGGLPFSEYVTAQQLQAALQGAAATGTVPQPKTTTTAPTGQAAAAGTPPQPATDFTDNNTSEVLLVTQQGTGYAIHAITSGDAALFAENSNTSGTALKVLESASTGLTVGILAQTSSPEGIPAIFDNTSGQGGILRLQSNGNIVTTFSHLGDINTTGQILASRFNGDGSGLFNIPPSAINATPGTFANSVVARDTTGSFSANEIFANTFFGNGSGLTNIPAAAINATPGTFANSVVARDTTGSFSANQIFANTFFGNGSGLTNIPAAAINATPGTFANSVVARDTTGSFSANQITANNFSGNGSGLFGIPPFAVGATPLTFGNAIVQRDFNGSFSANQITANSFSGSGLGLFGIPPFAVGATDVNISNAIVQRDASGNFSATNVFALGLNATGQLTSTGFTDLSNSFTSPVHAVQAANTPATCSNNRELLIKTDVAPGQQLFICNATGNGWNLVGDGVAAGVGGIVPGDSSIVIGGTPQLPSISVPNGGITAAKLAPNAISSSIADGSLTAAKIAGTAATLSTNTFNGNQTILQNLTVNGLISNSLGFTTTNSVFAAGGNFTGSTNGQLLTVTNTNSAGSAMLVNGNVGIGVGGTVQAINASTVNGIGVRTSSNSSYGLFASSTNAIGAHVEGGTFGLEAVSSTNGSALKAFGVGNAPVAIFDSNIVGPGITLMSGRRQGVETFAFDNAGNWSSHGGLTVSYPNNTTTGTFVQFLAKLDVNGNAIMASTSDTSGIIGIVASGSGTSGSAQVTFSGLATCNFDGTAQIGHYVGISSTQAGRCSDAGPAYPKSGQVIGQVISSGVASQVYNVLVFGQAQRDSNLGTLTTINTGAGLTGGPITSSGTISIANNGVTNAMLQNQFLFVNTGTGLSGGGPVSLGGSLNLSNTGVLSFNGRSGGVVAASGDYSFAQIAGTAGSSQLPSTTVYNNQSNIFSADQTVQGNLSASGNLNAGGSVTANAITGTSANLSGAATSTLSVLAVNDTGASGSAISVNSANNPAALFTSSGPTVFMAGKITGATTILSSNGDLTLNGAARASAFSGDGSALTNVSATKIGTLAQADIATNVALGAETTARQNADTAIQSSVASETTARQSGDNALQNNINAETTARASADSSLQANINSVSLASAQLGAANTFTAKQTMAASTASNAGFGLLAGTAPATPLTGDVWNTGTTLQYRDNAATTRSLVSTTQSGGLQLLKLTASITPASVSSQVCTEQSFAVSGINTGDVLLSVLQPSTSSPGSNIAIGGFRVSAANTVAVQFCNVSRNNNTPTAGTYTFAFMR